MSIHHKTELRKGVRGDIAWQRKQRLKKILNLNAPEVIVIAMAETYLRSFKWSYRGMWNSFKLNHLPTWLLKLIDVEYRQIAKECEAEDAEGAA